MAYSKLLIDSIGNSHERKNQFLKELLEAPGDQKSQLLKNKESHPYIVKLKELKKREQEFLEKIDKEADEKFKSEEDKKILKLQKRDYKAEKKIAFYKDLADFDYDFEYAYKVAKHERKHIPEIIENDWKLKKSLEEKTEELSKIDPGQRAEVLEEIQKKKDQRKEVLDKEIASLKDKHARGIISSKALKTEIKIRKRAWKEDVTSYLYLDKKTSLEQEIKNIKHHLKIDFESKMNVLESDIADVRRKTPTESYKSKPIFSYLTFLIPGLGQFLNKQYVKALLFFLGSLFIYLIAIPYALGFGNYKGQGIAGLMSLAQDGKRLDKSIIFMIEGIIAIALCLIALGIYWLSFKDVNKVEKDLIKGIRPRNWFETKNSISTDGFPYLVSAPAGVLVLFIVLVPIVTTFLISFTNYNPDHQSKFFWTGFENYRLLFLGQGVAGKAFWPIVFWTIIWTFGATTLAIAIGFILSLIANQERIRFKGLFRTIYLLPWAVPAFITIMFFSQMVAVNGPITQLIDRVFGVSIDVKNSTNMTRLALIMLQGWLGSAYVFLLSTGILQGIPKDLYEAAEIDGATGFQRTLKITIPLVLFQTGPLLIGQYTFNFNNFSIIHLFNGGGPFDPTVYGNLAGSTDLLISYIYKLTIQNNYQALGAAVTIIISLVLMFFSFIGFKNTKAFKED
ncbi:MAG: ABC transporter permease subunit [Tissierellia bacterium]|nr:ABC transporter permease subunit [Tissierellia bacterium]